MLRTKLLQSGSRVVSPLRSCRIPRLTSSLHTQSRTLRTPPTSPQTWPHLSTVSTRHFQYSAPSSAQGPSADALMEALTDLYATAKDEFEIAAEETEKKTVYAEDDRAAAKEALNNLKKAYERALKESAPEVAKEVQSRTGPRIRELENALTAVEESAMED